MGDLFSPQTSHQKLSYRHLKSEVTRSQKEVHYVKGGIVRERPITAPNISMYSQRDVEEFKRKQSIAAQGAIFSKLHDLLQHAYKKDKSKII